MDSAVADAYDLLLLEVQDSEQPDRVIQWYDGLLDCCNLSNEKREAAMKARSEYWDRHFRPDDDPRRSSRTHYEVLGVPRNATLKDITKTYRRLVLQYHPGMPGLPLPPVLATYITLSLLVLTYH